MWVGLALWLSRVKGATGRSETFWVFILSLGSLEKQKRTHEHGTTMGRDNSFLLRFV